MELGFQNLSWLHDCVEDFHVNGAIVDTESFGDQTLEQRNHDAFPAMHSGVVNEFVNPADLHRVEGDVSNYSDQIEQMATQLEVQTPPMDNGAMDEFFRLQGGWRPPAPCNHCKRLRLQCFMLQTTVANPNPITA
jgi:hypothetical protein